MNEVELSLEKVDCEEILNLLGYSCDNPAPQQLLERVATLLGAVSHTAKGFAATSKIKSLDQDGVLTEFGRITSQAFSQLANEAENVVYGVVTAGEKMDKLLHTCEDMVDSMVYDAIGSVIVEQSVDAMRMQLANQNQAYISLPFSPGYCDYPLQEQEAIFAALGGSPLGIQYHPDSFMMTPIKTVSFVAATGKKPLNTNPCSLCTLKKCRMRRAK